jgi:hypothetical protein
LSARASRPGRAFLFRIPKGSDLQERIAAFCRKHRVATAAVSAIGATDSVTLGYYDQRKGRYFQKTLKGDLEILSCSGNVSLKEGQPFAHLHAVMGDAKLRVSGGHLFASKVFAAEVFLSELKGPALVRRPDLQTGLALWPRPFQG